MTPFKRRLAEWSKPDPDWHRQQSAAAEQAKDWFAVAFHRRQLARILQEQGQRKDAAEQTTAAEQFTTKHKAAIAAEPNLRWMPPAK